MRRKAISLDTLQDRGVVLIVDDEEPVREVTEDILTLAGMDVETVASGSEAIEFFRTRSRDVSLVLIDMSMPDMDGEETYRRLRAIREDVPAIICSGSADSDAHDRLGDMGVAGFLEKPFGVDTLLDKFSQVLGE